MRIRRLFSIHNLTAEAGIQAIVILDKAGSDLCSPKEESSFE
jgi:hypothetical protein